MLVVTLRNGTEFVEVPSKKRKQVTFNKKQAHVEDKTLQVYKRSQRMRQWKIHHNLQWLITTAFPLEIAKSEGQCCIQKVPGYSKIGENQHYIGGYLARSDKICKIHQGDCRK